MGRSTIEESAMSGKLKIYEYSNCGTCKQALKFLDAKKASYEKIAIVETPPSIAELKSMLGHLGGELKKLFNTSGQVYREMKLGEKLPEMSEAQALKLLAANGKLIKRPFLLAPKGGAVGFKEAEWKKLL
jgi:arsenate reductase (glutaredoxin)